VQHDLILTELCWTDGNLYVGTTAAEILHFVSLPADPSDDSSTSTFMLASRLQPNPEQTDLPAGSPGVQQILLLPAVSKACVLCNGIATFYSLPELTPAFGNMSVQHCTFIGGLDLNSPRDGVDDHHGQVVMIATSSRIMVVRISDEPPRRIKRLDFQSCLKSARRDAIACVADGRMYALLEVEHLQKIPLFPISSLDDTKMPQPGRVEDVSVRGSHTPSGSTSLLPVEADQRGHGRSTSLGTFMEGLGKRQQSPRPESQGISELRTPDLAAPGMRSPLQAASPERKPSQPPSPTKDGATTSKSSNTQDGDATQKALPDLPKPKAITPLKPHILSPSSNEFLLTTGTELSEPGVGMFVNLDGDVVRGTIEFSRYPQTVILDGVGGEADTAPEPSEGDDEEGFVLAIIPADPTTSERPKVEVQRWDLDPGDSRSKKTYFEIPPSGVSTSSKVGIHNALSSTELSLHEIGESLCQVRLNLSGKRPLETSETSVESSDPRTKASMEHLQKEKELFEVQDSTDSENGNISCEQIELEEKRNMEEARRLEKWTGRILMWSGDRIWWVVKNPLVLQLDGALGLAEGTEETGLDRAKVVAVFNELRGKNPRTEMEFLGMNYIRQKASLLLFVDLLTSPRRNIGEYQEAMKVTENALIEGGLDPRVLVLMVPLVRREVVQGPRGVEVPAGLSEVVRNYVLGDGGTGLGGNDSELLDENLLVMIKRYLSFWRDQKGFASLADGQSASTTVDASLLHILLHLDQQSPRGPAEPHSLRAELNRVVDSKVGNFGRAVELLESYQRLYVLSRLYQSKKMAKDVLGTWKRIIDGEKDVGGELSTAEVEVQIRRYLGILRDRKLIEQYGTWLAARNPKLAIQVFADDKSKIKFLPSEVIAMLKKGAPGAVQEYLEHLVFVRNVSVFFSKLIPYLTKPATAIRRRSYRILSGHRH
jgi:vacuolar protein sorting-associated protein 3